MAKIFALRLNFVDVICDDSLENTYINGKKAGFKFDVRLSYYRGHFLSTIDEMGVKVDGEEIPTESIYFSLRGQEYGVAQLHSLVNEFWHITEPAEIRVFYPGGLSKGEHKVEFTMYFRSPYMAIAEDKYMPIDSCGEKILVIR